MIDQLHQIAEERGGECLSCQYKGATKKLLWECAKGHQWEAAPDSIKRGTWCPYCAGRAKLTIVEMHKTARDHGGMCLSDKIATKLLWECSEGHRWEATAANVKRGTWCPHCARTVKRTIEEMHRLAEDRGGRCLSDVYKSGHAKLRWECSKGHQWEAGSANIRLYGRWCPVCAGNVKRTLEDMQSAAEKRGGKCLSVTYKNCNTNLLWECGEGHQWEALPSNILRGTWCRKCSYFKQGQSE